MSVNRPDPTQQPPPAPPGNPPAPDERDAAFAAWLEDPANAEHTRKLRNENAQYRIRARQAEKRLTELDPTGSHTVDVTKHQAEARQLRIDNQVLTTAHELGIGDLRRLRFELHESQALSSLDPSDEHFRDDVHSMIEEMTVNIPELLKGGRQSNIAPITGAHIRPGTSGPTQLSRADISRMTADEIADAQRRGLLDSVLGRRGPA